MTLPIIPMQCVWTPSRLTDGCCALFSVAYQDTTADPAAPVRTFAVPVIDGVAWWHWARDVPPVILDIAQRVYADMQTAQTQEDDDGD